MLDSSRPDIICCTNSTICLLGFDGPLCLACDEEHLFVKNQAGMCVYCRNDLQFALAIGVQSLVILTFVVISVIGLQDKYKYSLMRKSLRIGFNITINSVENSPYFIKIVTNYISTIVIITSLKSSMPGIVSQGLNFF